MKHRSGRLLERGDSDGRDSRRESCLSHTHFNWPIDFEQTDQPR
jgi:hypothetical protein